MTTLEQDRENVERERIETDRRKVSEVLMSLKTHYQERKHRQEQEKKLGGLVERMYLAHGRLNGGYIPSGADMERYYKLKEEVEDLQRTLGYVESTKTLKREKPQKRDHIYGAWKRALVLKRKISKKIDDSDNFIDLRWFYNEIMGNEQKASHLIRRIMNRDYEERCRERAEERRERAKEYRNKYLSKLSRQS